MPIDYSKLSDEALKGLSDGQPLDYSKLPTSDLEELAHPASERYSTTEQILKTAAEGAATVPTLGASTGIERSLGVKPEDIQGRREANPIAHAVGQIAGGTALAYVAPAVAPLTSIILAATGDEVSKMLSNDPHQSLATAITSIGLSGVLGGAVGKTGSKLWEAASESKLGRTLEGFKAKAMDAAMPYSHSDVNKGAQLAERLGAYLESKAKPAASVTGAALGKLTGIGSYVGHLVGERALSPLMESVLPAIAKPIIRGTVDSKAAKAAINYGMQVARGEALINKAANAVFTSAKAVLPEHALPDEKELAKLDAQVEHSMHSPEGAMSVGESLSHYMPEHTTAITEKAASTIQYLAAQKPRPTQSAPLDQPQPPTLQQAQAYKRTLTIAQQPLTVLQHIAQGSLVPKDVQDLAALYPHLYQKLEQKLTEQAMDHIAKGNAIPHKTKQGLSLFTAMPLAGTLTPQSIQSIQMTFENKKQQAAQQQAQAKPNKSANAFEKGVKLDRTPGQAREASRASKE
jgi:hypothetical protein